MKLLTQEIRSKLPPLGGQDGNGGKAIAWLKLFMPSSCFTWYVTEYDGQDMMFGLVDGMVRELGYFRLSELKQVRGPFGLGVERDIHWQPKPLEEIAPELFTPLKPAE